jgi:hypothetical protein
MKEGSVRTTFNIPDHVLAAVDLAARAEFRSRSSLVAATLAEALGVAALPAPVAAAPADDYRPGREW